MAGDAHRAVPWGSRRELVAADVVGGAGSEASWEEDWPYSIKLHHGPGPSLVRSADAVDYC